MKKHEIIIIGAGVVGLSAANYLLREGKKVSVIDPLPAPGGASFGNAGMICPGAIVPIALPGMIKKVPAWLLDPLGPLSVSFGYVPRAIPWLTRWVLASRRKRVLQIVTAMHSLHRDSLDRWRELLGDALQGELIRRCGQIQLWESQQESPLSQFERKLRELNGIDVRLLKRSEIEEKVPGIARSVRGGFIIDCNAHTVNPARLVQTLADIFKRDGGEIIAERVVKIVPTGQGNIRVITNVADRLAQNVVVAAGAWSKGLLRSLGIHIPLETERGYHAMIESPELSIPQPVVFKDRGFALTPMETGIRLAGTVEIAGLDAPPNESRAERLLVAARQLFPKKEMTLSSVWMGHRPSLPDSLPILDNSPIPGLTLAFGSSHFGMTGGPPSGRIVADLVMRRAPNIDPAPYRLARFHH